MPSKPSQIAWKAGLIQRPIFSKNLGELRCAHLPKLGSPPSFSSAPANIYVSDTSIRALGDSFSIAHAQAEPIYRLSSQQAVDDEIKTGLPSLVWKNFGEHYRRFKQKLAPTASAPTDSSAPPPVQEAANFADNLDLFAPLSPLSSAGNSPTVSAFHLPNAPHFLPASSQDQDVELLEEGQTFSSVHSSQPEPQPQPPPPSTDSRVHGETLPTDSRPKKKRRKTRKKKPEAQLDDVVPAVEYSTFVSPPSYVVHYNFTMSAL